MDHFNYLTKLLQTDRFEKLPELSGFFKEYQDNLFQKNVNSFHHFLKKMNLAIDEGFAQKLYHKLYKIEKNIQAELGIHDFSQKESIHKIWDVAQRYLENFSGIFIKKSAAKKILFENPMYQTRNEIGENSYNELVNEDPLFLLAIGRHAEPAKDGELSWNKKSKALLTKLTKLDFEYRITSHVVVDHTVFRTASQRIIERKCFSTHDKLTGMHVISTLPKDFSLEDKCPILRTLSKMFHYQKEIQIFTSAFECLYNEYPSVFGSRMHEILAEHKSGTNRPLFNTHDVIEGVANQDVNAKVGLMVKDFPELAPWAQAHDIAHVVHDKFLTTSLWRLTSWSLSGQPEQSVTMYRDNVLADMLNTLYGKALFTQAVRTSLLDGGGDVTETVKRLHYVGTFKNITVTKHPRMVLLYHVDTDGIAGGYIIQKTLKELDISCAPFAIEILTPAEMDKILSQFPREPLIILDLGTDIVNHLIKKNIPSEVYIIDHHKYSAPQIPNNIHIFNPRAFGINADFEGCSSINANIFSNNILLAFLPDQQSTQHQSVLCQLSPRVNKYAAIAMMGVLGDNMIKRNGGRVIGLDFCALAASFQNKELCFEEGNYFLNFKGQKVLLQDFVRNYIDLAGSVGFQSGGVQLAFDLLDQKIDLDDIRLQHLQELQKAKYEMVLSFLKEKQTARQGSEKIKKSGKTFEYFEDDHILAFNLGDLFHPMSLKEVGTFLDYLLLNRDSLPLSIPEDKYLIGAQRLSGENSKMVKVSMRVGPSLAQEIELKHKPDLYQITSCFENTPGGIHTLSAAVIMPELSLGKMLKTIVNLLTHRE